MKIRILPFLSVLFALPVCSAFADTETLTANITNADSPQAALKAYDTESEKLLKEYKTILPDNEYEELESLIKKHRSQYNDAKTNNSQETDENPKKDNESGASTKESQETESGLRKPTAEEQKEIDELADNAQAAKDKEQSTANKLIGAAGIGATGIGGMMLASGLAEQSADTDAETAMRAYLETFYCKIGENGSSIKGGTRGAIVPGGNEIINLYSEYVNLANSLKTRKSALNMLPGIESEAILDSATSGLYDDVYTGKTGGAYASLARAMQNPNGADANAWAEQKQKSSDDVTAGAITAGIGAAGSLIANLAVNVDTNKDNEKIKNKYNGLPDAIKSHQENINKITVATTCAEDSEGEYPKCKCKNNQYYNAETNTCANNTVREDTITTPSVMPDAPIAKITIPNHIVFSTGTTVSLNDSIEKEVTAIAQTLKKQKISGTDTCVFVIGHTDRISQSTNDISAKRANAISTILNNNSIKNTITHGLEHHDCTTDAPDDSSCRHVDIIIDAGKCDK